MGINGRVVFVLVSLVFFPLISTGCTNKEHNSEQTYHTNYFITSPPKDQTLEYTEPIGEELVSAGNPSHPEPEGHIQEETPDEELDDPVEEGADCPSEQTFAVTLPQEGAEEFLADPVATLTDDSQSQPEAIPSGEQTAEVNGGCIIRTGSNEITLSWDPPSHNTDGSPLVDLTGYRVFLGQDSQTFSRTIEVNVNTNPTIYNLSPGTWYFSVKSYNMAGQESDFSNKVCASL